MTKRIATGVALIAALGLAFAPMAGAAEGMKETKAQRMQREIAEQEAATRTLAHKMMGHVNLAELALDVNLNDEALEHVTKAKKIADQLRAEAPEVISKTQYKYGKLSYKFEDETRHYYVPVMDDVYLLSDYRETHHAFSKEDFEELDAGVMEVTVSADLREVENALGDAEAKIKAKDLPGARLALSHVFKNAITDEEVVTDPVWAVHDNIALARNLVEFGNYDAARMALEHAKTRLTELEKGSKDAKASEEFKRMHSEVSKVQADLHKKDPTVRQRIGDRFSSWMGSIGSWF